VRGIETAAERVAGVVTEKGRIAGQSVVLPGCLVAPVLRATRRRPAAVEGLGSVMRTEPLTRSEISATGGCWVPQRMDAAVRRDAGGAHDRPAGQLPPLPDYPPSVRLHWKKLRFRVGRRFVEEWQTSAAGRSMSVAV
jgi:hypothetical protein